MRPSIKIALSIFLIIGLSALVLWWNPPRSESETSKQHLWTNKTHNPNGQDIVVYGDSRVYRGFSTEAFLSDKNYDCFNYGYSSGSYSKRMLGFCTRQLKSENEGIYVFGITPHAFTKSAALDDHYKQENARSTYDVNNRLLKSHLLRHFDPISAQDFLGWSKQMETFHFDGWISKSNVVFDTLAGLESYKKTYSSTEIDSNVYYNFFEFVQEETNKGRTIYGYHPPTMISMDALEKELTTFRYEDFIPKFQAAGGIWIDVPRTGYEAYDGSHLTTASTIELSKYLGEKILGN